MTLLRLGRARAAWNYVLSRGLIQLPLLFLLMNVVPRRRLPITAVLAPLEASESSTRGLIGDYAVNLGTRPCLHR